MMKRQTIIFAGFILPLGASGMALINNTFLYAMAVFFVTQFLVLLGLSISTKRAKRTNKNKGVEI